LKSIFMTFFLLTILTGCGGSTFELLPDLKTNSTASASITTSTLADAPTDLAYSQTLAASNGTGNLTWKVASGALPTGLSLSTGGIISGTPTAVTTATAGTGLYSFTVSVTDSPATPATATRSLSIFTPTTGRMYDPTLKVYAEGLAFDSSTLTFSLTVMNTDSAAHTIQVVVSDYENTGTEVAHSSFNMTPTAVNAGASTIVTTPIGIVFAVNNWRIKSVSIL